MKNILFINGIIEGLAGFVLIFRPQLLLSHAQPDIQGVIVAKLYGIIALCFGITSYLLSKIFNYHTDVFKRIVLVVIAFHFAVGMFMYGVYQQNITSHPGASLLHTVIAVVFLMIYLKNMHHFKEETDEPAS
jgi:cell shape-determining protein MreD